jgi:hypothetical protein
MQLGPHPMCVGRLLEVPTWDSGRTGSTGLIRSVLNAVGRCFPVSIPTCHVCHGHRGVRHPHVPRTSHYPCSGFWGQVKGLARRSAYQEGILAHHV